jgi:hypothetical protein
VTGEPSPEADPKLRHDPPEIPGYRLEDRPAIPIGKLNLLAFPLAIPFGVFFYLIGSLLQPGDEIILRFTLLRIAVLLVIILIGVPVLHEVVHGLVARFLGARPFYGIGQGFAYTSFHEAVTPRQYMLITAAPLVILSLVSIVMFGLRAEWFIYILAFAVTNAAGAIGDLWILWRIRQLPQDALIYDLADGYAAFVLEHRTLAT